MLWENLCMFSRRSFLCALPALLNLISRRRLVAEAVSTREFHVSPAGNDAYDGSASRPLRTISAAAARAYPGDTVTVHAGIYRERVAPPRGGRSNTNRIVYQAAPGERVVITGAEVIKGWARVKDDVWKVSLPNGFFGSFNPFNDVIHGDWFDPKGRVHHTGAVYLNGDWLAEAAALGDVLENTAEPPLWFAQVESDVTTIWAQFVGADPNQQQTEINVRQAVFYPAVTGIDYITVRGFDLCQAATPWAPPTAEQIGVIGPHWSKGWMIENNNVHHSICCGISLGKYGDQWDNTSANTAQGYVKTIERATQSGWSKQKIGHHVVRNNTISHCEQAGIVGSLGPVFSIVTGNTIHDIHVRQLFSGAEIAGIKFHAAIDVEISRNHIYRTYRGLWLDWMAQGTHVFGNLFHDTQSEDLFVEVDHGPFLIDDNVFLSKKSQHINSQGGACAHNLFCGGLELNQYDGRMTPFMKPHSTQVAGYHDNPSGDMRFFNNLFAQNGDLSPFDVTRLPVELAGNVFLKGARPCAQGAAPQLMPDFDPNIHLIEKSDGLYLEITLDSAWAADRQRKLVTSDLLGLALIPKLPFQRADGTPIRLGTDFSGVARNSANPFPGPFEHPGGGRFSVKVFPAQPQPGNAV
jgi:alpha-L-arabinofuranosidase